MNAQGTVGRGAVLLVGLLLIAGCGQPKEQNHIDPESRAQQRGFDHRYYKGMGDEHLAETTERIRLNPNDAEAYYFRAFLHHLSERHDEAIADLTEAIRLNPNNAEVYYDLRARAHGVNGAAKALAILLEDPTAEAAAEEARQLPREKAIADFTEVIRLNPNDAYAYYSRGVIHLLKGEQDKAAADFVKSKQFGFWPVNPMGSYRFFEEYPALKEKLNSGTSPSE